MLTFCLGGDSTDQVLTIKPKRIPTNIPSLVIPPNMQVKRIGLAFRTRVVMYYEVGESRVPNKIKVGDVSITRITHRSLHSINIDRPDKEGSMMQRFDNGNPIEMLFPW